MNNPWLQIDRQMVGDIYTADELMNNLTVLCDDYGARFGGTREERLAANFMLEKLTSYGWRDARLEPFSYIGWQRGQTTLEVVSPISKKIPCISLPHSPPADINALLFDAGEGAPQKFESDADAIGGKIVMADSVTYPHGVKRWIHRNEKYGRTILAGGVGFIFINHYPAYGPATGGIGHNGEGLIPGVSVSYEDGKYLQRLVQRFGEVRVRIMSTDHSMPMESWNVIADLPGTDDDTGMVMFGSHYDGHDISQGASDPASGTVAALEAARVIAAYAGPRRQTLRIALWGVEEIGLLGSYAYVDQHADELDKVRFYLNMDGAGGAPDRDVVLNEWPSLEGLFAEWKSDMALDFEIGQSIHAHSDHYPFLMQGVPTGGMERLKRDTGGRGYGHTRYDTLDKVNPKHLREAAALAARLLIRVADTDKWPVHRRSTSEVKTILEGDDYREEVEYTAAIDAFYAKARAEQRQP